MRAIFNFLFYSCCAVAPALFLFIKPNILDQNILKVLPYFFYGSIGLCAYLGFKINQGKIVLSTFLMGLIFESNFLMELFKEIGIEKQTASEILFLGLPAFLLLNLSIKEFNFLSIRNIFRTLITILPFAGLIILSLENYSLFMKISEFKLVTKFDTYLILSIVSALIVYFNKDERTKEFRLVSILSIISLYTWGYLELTNSRENQEFVKLLAFSSIAMTYLHSILFMFWKRVYIDELTSLSNRRALDESLSKLGRKYSIAMIDIDHFKKFNDTYGHDQGDDVLKLVAKTLYSVLGNKVYRYGGEEFTAIFNKYDSLDAAEVLDEVRDKLSKLKFHVRSKQTPRKKTNRGKGGGKKVSVTISIGVSQYGEKANEPEKVIKIADNALYKAKKRGRNCVVVAA